jgi:leucyl-tRNA synthetase
MSPIAPHLAEELWNIKENNFVSNELYPQLDIKKISEKDETGEFLISKLIDDANEIIKVTNIKPKKIYIYLSPKWKWKIFRIALKLSSKGKLNVGKIMKEAISDPEMKKISNMVAIYSSKLPSEIKKLNENDKKRYLIKLDSAEYLENAKDYLKDVFSCNVEIYRGDKEKIYDPDNRARYAVPLRPAIYIK